MPSDLPSPEPVELNDLWATADTLRFELDEHDLARGVITTPVGDAAVYPHGAHVTHYQPRGGEPVIWLSRESRFAPGVPIRGGVPICFPWFGPKKDDPDAPMHGTARLENWDILEVFDEGEGLDIELGLTVGPLRAVYRVAVGAELGLTLTVTNQSDQAQRFEAALHTYFAVADIRRATLAGLEGATYLDKVDGMNRKTQGPEPIHFAGETDRLYLDTQSPCLLDDPGLGRRITIDKAGSESTVVWNPWADKAKGMADFAEDEWPGMVCVETANAADNAVTLEPGRAHAMTQTVRVEAR